MGAAEAEITRQLMAGALIGGFLILALYFLCVGTEWLFRR